MIGASKILTVSYGTFSCTLEGFDEPFNTMKGIAEYFRDLAADDRYFGAEPPIPDAAMLHRIAEREIHRRVEAKIQDNGVILRASSVGDQDSPPRPVMAPAARLQPSNQGPVPGTVPVESVAAKLMRIRAAAVAADADPIDSAPQATLPMAAPDLLPEMPTVSAEALAADHIPDFAELADQDDGGTMADTADSLSGVAAMPSRGAGATVGGLAGQGTDTHVVPEAIAVDDPVAIDDDDAEDWLDEPAAGATRFAAISAGDDDDLDMGYGVPARTLETIEPSAPTVLTDLFPEDDPDDAAVQTTPAGPWQDADLDLDDAAAAPVAAGNPDEDDDALAAALAEEPPVLAEETPVLAEPPLGRADPLPAAPGPAAAAPLNSGAMAKIQRARARIIKIHRVFAPDAVPAMGSTGLTAEAEAALARALADDRRDAAAQIVPTPVAANRPVRRLVAVDATEPAVDASVNRLMAQTATEMDVPEQRRRRSAIEHLKAAVAATIDDRRVGGPLPPSEDELTDPYRSDLSEMVGTGSATPVARSTPLVLVSEQRIDRISAQAGVDASRGAVGPRRVGTAPLALRDMVMDSDDADDEDDDAGQPIDPRGFAEFAARLNVRSLPDFLEAAAAYTAIVEGRPHFSRPHLMRQVGTVVTDVDFTRETGLRGFGTLLRTGRILRVKRGQYALAKGSRYMTDMAGE